MLALRREVVPSRRNAYSLEICRLAKGRIDAFAGHAGETAPQSPFIPRALVVAVYLATKEEIDLSALISELSTEALHTVVAPKWLAQLRTYGLAELDCEGVVPGHWGIDEPVGEKWRRPEEVDVWIVPGLAFTRSGARLGYGGGYYDRYFSACPHGRRIAVAYPFQILPEIPSGPHDQPIDEILVSLR